MKNTALVAAVLSLAACDFPTGGERPEGIRFVTGALAAPAEDLFGRQNTGLQIAAISVAPAADDGVDIDAFTSGVFDATRIENTRFAAQVPDDRSFVVVLQVPSGSTRGPGALLATLRFEDGRGQGTLLPPGATDIELGTLDVEVGSSVATNALVVGDASNPLAQVDTDADGSSDLSDDDDDGDDVPDATDPDVGGDGLDDARQVLPGLTDEDADGIPDLLEG